MPLRLRKFLDELLDVLREDYPKQLSRLIQDANGLTYLQVLDKERAVITVRNRRITIATRISACTTSLRRPLYVLRTNVD